MAILWSCVCGMSFDSAPECAGQTFVCPRCALMNEIPASSTLVQMKAASANAIPSVVPVPENVPLVVPLDEEIPEVDVEEHDDVDDDDADTFEGRLAAARDHAYSTVGTIDLAQPTRCVAYGPGGAWGLAAQDDEILTLNLHKGKKLDRFGDHTGIVTALAISKANDFCISGDDEGGVLYWDIPTCKRWKRMRVHRSAITAAAIAGDVGHAATGDREGLIVRWGLPDAYEERLVESEWSEKITALTYSSDSTLFAAGGSKGRVNVWSLPKGGCVQRFRLPNLSVAGLEFLRKAEAILALIKPARASIPTFPKVYRLDLKTGQAQECFRPAEAARIFPDCALLTRGGKRLLCAGRAWGDNDYPRGKNILEIWSLATAQRLHAFRSLNAEVECLAVTTENKRVIAATAKRQVKVFTMPERDTPGEKPAGTIVSQETGFIKKTGH